MLTDKGFIRWANEHVVVLVSHNELGHEEIVDEKLTGPGSHRCPLYPGLTCRQHLDISVETDNPRDDELPVIPFIELLPNSWLVRPDGEVERIPEADQFGPKGVREAAAKAQAALGEALSVEAYTKLLPLAKAAEEALDGERWRAALTALAGLRAGVKRPGAGLTAWIDARLRLVDEEVGFLFEDALEAEDLSDAERARAVAARLAEVDVAVGTRYVPVRDRIVKWLAAHPPPERTGK